MSQIETLDQNQTRHPSGVRDSWWATLPADSDVVEVPSFEDERVEEDATGVYTVLQEEAAAAQRLVVSRNSGMYVKGSAEKPVYDSGRTITPEKMFRVSGLIDWVSGDPESVITAMRKGRVRARVSAAMGMGKSTLLPMYVAEQMDHRVLFVSLDAAAMGQSNAYMRTTGKGAFRRTWQSKVRAWVCCMTYADFCSYSAMARRKDMFQHFETFIFDEAAVPLPAVSAALKMFTVLAGPETNLLMSSATIRTDAVEDGISSTRMGNVQVTEKYISPDDAMVSGRLVDKYLADRTMAILPTDELVHKLAEYYASNGVDVQVLDSAARQVEVDAIGTWMRGDSSTPRVLVAHSRFKIAFNFPVAFIILWPVEAKLRLEGSVVVEDIVPMSQAMVNQAVSRAGRGIVDSASALVMGPERGDEKYMSLMDKVDEYVILSHAYVRPLQTEEWAGAHAIFPDGLPPNVAQLLRKVNLPAQIAMRYLAEDGKFAAKFVPGLTFFTQQDHFIYPSRHQFPVGYEGWVDDTVVGSASSMVKVPVLAGGELQVVLQAITAISENNISIKRWRCDAPMTYSDGNDSGDESEFSSVTQRVRLRRVRSVEWQVVEEKKPLPKLPWSFSAASINTEMGGAGTRKAVVLPQERYKSAMRELCGVVDEFRIVDLDLPVRETGAGTVAQVELPLAEVESPGGSIVCEISGELSSRLNSGRVLSGPLMKELVQMFRTHGERLVAARLFDCMGNSWTSTLGGFLTEDVVQTLIHAGLASHAYALLWSMNNRFAMEVIGVVKYSNVYKRRYAKVFSRSPTMDEMMKAIRRGNFRGIAQSEAFINRVLQIKGWLDHALVMAEGNGVYLPNHITDAQRTLPIHGATPLGHVAQGSMVAQPMMGAISSGLDPRLMWSRGHVKGSSVNW